MAQALGGRFGLPQGAMNAICLPAALRFNAEAVPERRRRASARRSRTDDPAARVEELARLGGFERLRDFGVPEAELGAVAEADRAAAGREGESAAGERRRRRAAAALDLVALTLNRSPSSRR